MASIDEYFRLMVNEGASDLHIVSGSAPWLRLDGEMVPTSVPALTPEAVQTMLFEILSEKQKRQFMESWELDCSYTIAGLGRFRCNIFMQRKGMGAVFRMIPEKIRSAEELGLPKEVLDMVNAHKGLVCVTGPTGSGKSTTLAALIHHINARQQSHILTIEDPIEFIHPSMKSLVNQREVHGHTKSFANALKAALREDPDIILVGEMRDLETIQLAITAAETGHLVFGTLHTNNAAKTVDRIIDVFPGDRQAQIRAQLAESLRGVIAQALLPKATGRGRVAALEILNNTRAVANLIRDGKTFQIPSTMQTGKGQGMVTFEAHVEGLVGKGLITREVASEFLGKTAPEVPAPAKTGSSTPGASAAAAASAQPSRPTAVPNIGTGGANPAAGSTTAVPPVSPFAPKKVGVGGS